MPRNDSAARWLAVNDPERRPPSARHPRGRALIETRWDGAEFIRVWLPGRTYRREHITRLTRREAEALVRNLGKRLAELPEDGTP